MKSSLEILVKGEFGEDLMVENGMGKIEVGKEEVSFWKGRKLNYAVKFRNRKLTNPAIVGMIIL